ncbi:hypothetical protein [Undibacterium sp.]|uniref:hypothetical protein n=1 Tax=Undibacterium sp. TaxID=1914977 RepID=UPI002C87ADD5|nr:hypothetical protein [Undibacterium sp.]HTD03238.1 hypothetical protein [Undibacterium sp.]
MNQLKSALNALYITEGVSGTKFYHLSTALSKSVSLCDKLTMNANLPLSHWGTKTQMKERYCAKCEAAGAEALAQAGVTLAASPDRP